jgi:hypothetical protein
MIIKNILDRFYSASSTPKVSRVAFLKKLDLEGR